MLAGKTVVATRVGGIPEYVTHKENGYLVEPESPESLAKGISALLDDLPLRRSLEKKASEMVPGMFTWDKVAQRYLANFSAL
jgi:glycosyltransferase involved in cell wall biosynthesis